MTKSDLKSTCKIAAVIMKWLSQGIPFLCWNVGTYSPWAKTPIFTYQYLLGGQNLVMFLMYTYAKRII